MAVVRGDAWAMMPLPRPAAWEWRLEADRLALVGAGVGAASEGLSGRHEVGAGAWSGAAASAFEGVWSVWTSRVSSVTAVVSSARAAMLTAADAGAEFESECARARAELHGAQQAEARAAAVGVYVVPGATAAADRAWQRYERARAVYGDQMRGVAARLRAAVAVVPDRRRTVDEHLDDAAEGFVRAALVQPVVGVWSLTGAGITDPAGWRATWLSLGTGLSAQGVAVREDPGAAARSGGSALWAQTTQAEARRNGAWGSAVGGLGAMGVSFVKFRPPTPEVHRFIRNVQNPHATRPSPQSLQQWVGDGVNLLRSEHATLGHTISRHVDVTDEYLEDRLRNGTLQADGTRERAPSAASAWTDLATAERVTNQVVQDPANAAALKAWLASGSPRPWTKTIDVEPGAGRVMRLVDGRATAPGAVSRATIVIGKDKDGLPYVKTTTLE